MRISIPLCALFAVACSSAPATHHPVDAVAPAGETIYFGEVFPLKSPGAKPTYIYERRVADSPRGRTSSHVTRKPSGEVVLSESAVHTPGYVLEEYTLHANQKDQSGYVRVGADEIFFRLDEAGKTRTAVEKRRGDVVVGPTLVGHILERLSALRAGEKAHVRMAVLDRLETIGFELDSVAASPGQTRIRMKPTSPFVRLVMDPIYFTFEADRLVRLEGRVPTKQENGDDLDARVDYRYVASAYR